MTNNNFKPGDRVRCVDARDAEVTRGDIYTVTWAYVATGGIEMIRADFSGPLRSSRFEPVGESYCLKDGDGDWWVSDDGIYFDTADYVNLSAYPIDEVSEQFGIDATPTWVVGQTVSGADYAALPVGSVVQRSPETESVAKISEATWQYSGCGDAYTSDDDVFSYYTRTLTHIGTGVWPEPADLFANQEQVKQAATDEIAEALDFGPLPSTDLKKYQDVINDAVRKLAEATEVDVKWRPWLDAEAEITRLKAEIKALKATSVLDLSQMQADAETIEGLRGKVDRQEGRIRNLRGDLRASVDSSTMWRDRSNQRGADIADLRARLDAVKAAAEGGVK